MQLLYFVLYKQVTNSFKAEMKYKKPNSSGKARLGLLIAVLLVVGGAGVWPKLQASPPTNTVTRGIDIESSEGDFLFIGENGDGTAFVIINATLADGTFLGAFSFGVPVYSLSNDLQPGQSGHGNFSGTGQVTLDGSIIDPNTGDETPVVVSATMTVTGADEAGAFMRQGISPVRDPVTGETHVLREHSVGNQAFGLTVASFSVSADGNVLKAGTGHFGSVSTLRRHTIDRIR